MRTRHLQRLTPGVLALVIVLGGCGRSPELAADRAGSLQDEVLDVTTAAAAGDWDAADAGIASAHAQLDAALDADDVTTARYHEIDAALDRVTATISVERDKAAAQIAADQAAADAAAANPGSGTPTTQSTAPKTKKPKKNK